MSTNAAKYPCNRASELDSPIFIIGEAPGRLGADVSAIPFHGDKSGDNFERLLEQVGLSRHDCFITNAALCNPKGDNGNNATPTRAELQNCSGFLKRQIDLVDPPIVATLGAQALAALRSIEDHDIDLALTGFEENGVGIGDRSSHFIIPASAPWFTAAFSTNSQIIVSLQRRMLGGRRKA